MRSLREGQFRRRNDGAILELTDKYGDAWCCEIFSADGLIDIHSRVYIGYDEISSVDLLKMPIWIPEKELSYV